MIAALAIYLATGAGLAYAALILGVILIDREHAALFGEQIAPVTLPRLFAQQRSHVVSEGQGQGGGVQHHGKEP